VFDVIVEPVFVGFYLKVLGDVVFICIDFVLSKSGETCVLSWNFSLVRLHKGRVVGIFFRNNFESWLEVSNLGCRPPDGCRFGRFTSALSFESDWYLINTLQNFKLGLLSEVSHTVWHKSDCDVVLRVREKFSLGWGYFEVSDLGEVKVKTVVLALVFYGQNHVSAIVASAFTEAKVLLVDFDVRVDCTRHHLDFQINMLDALATFAKLHYGKRRIVFWLYLVLVKAFGICHVTI
jgi:hypothetical protein